MAVKALFILPGGELTLEKAFLIGGMHGGSKFTVPIIMALAVCDEGNILYDTGLHSGGIQDPTGTWSERAIRLCAPRLKKEDGIENRLAEIGLKLEDVHYVVDSHLHWDHIGGNRLFTKSRIIVQRAEYRFAQYPDPYSQASYLRNHFDLPGLHYELIDGDRKILEGVHALLTHGHTAGHQSLLVQLKKTGTVILAGDAIPTRENLEKELLPGPVWSAEASYQSLQRLKNIAEREKGQIFFCHDSEFASAARKSPLFYE